MNRFSKWWNKNKIRQQELETKLEHVCSLSEDLAKRNDELYKELIDSTIKLKEFEDKEKEIQDKQNSTEPWVEIKGERVDPVRGISLELDWNPAFIEYLKDNGITGADEDLIVQKWLSLLYGDLIEKFEERVIDNRDHYRPNEFE